MQLHLGTNSTLRLLEKENYGHTFKIINKDHKKLIKIGNMQLHLQEKDNLGEKPKRKIRFKNNVGQYS